MGFAIMIVLVLQCCSWVQYENWMKRGLSNYDVVLQCIQSEN